MYVNILAPPTWLIEPEDAEIVEGSITSFKCMANGHPIPRITWKKIGKFY